MRRRLLRYLATFTFRQAWLMLPLVILVTAVAIWLASRMDFDTSLIAFLSPTSLQNKNIGEIISDYRKLEPVMVIVRAKTPGHDAELISAAKEMARLLDYPHYFSSPVYKVDELAQEYYETLSNKRLVQLLTPEDWSELRQLMTEHISADKLRKLMAYRLSAFLPPRMAGNSKDDPLGALEVIRSRMASSRGPTRLETHNGYLMSPDRQAIIILVYPVLSPENGRDAIATLHFLEESRGALLKRFAGWKDIFQIGFEGSLISTAHQIQRMEEDQRLILTIAIPLVLLLILLVFRKVEAIVFIFLPPLVGLAWTLGLATLAFGGISVVTAGFLLVILAIGLQYNVHLYHRFILELYRGHNYYRALSRSYVETGRGILASAAVVSLIFFCLFSTSLRGAENWAGALRTLHDSRGFGQLGLVAGWGILCNLAACMLSLPLLAAIKHLLARGRIKPVALYRFGLERIYEPAIANPRSTLGIMLLVCVFFGYHARDLDFYPRFAAVSPFFLRTPEAPESAAVLEKSFPRPGRPIIAVVHGKTLQEAIERNDQLYENLWSLDRKYNLLAIDSLRTVLPSLRSQKASLDRLNELNLDPFRQDIERVSKEVGFKPVVYEPFLKALENFKQMAANPEYIEFNANASEVLISNVQRYITRKEDAFNVATVIYPHADGFAPVHLIGLSAALGKGVEGLKLMGDPLVERELSRQIKFNLAIMILLSVFIIFVALIVHYKSPRLAWLTFLPVVAEVVWLCGMMALTGLRIHFFTVLAMPLVLSLAMDNAMQLTQYYFDRQPCSVHHAMVSVGRVIMLTCGLTALLYGTVALASYPGMRDFGAVALYGTGAVLAGTVMLLPALLQLFGRGQPVLESLIAEGENDDD